MLPHSSKETPCKNIFCKLIVYVLASIPMCWLSDKFRRKVMKCYQKCEEKLDMPLFIFRPKSFWIISDDIMSDDT